MLILCRGLVMQVTGFMERSDFEQKNESQPILLGLRLIPSKFGTRVAKSKRKQDTNSAERHAKFRLAGGVNSSGEFK